MINQEKLKQNLREGIPSTHMDTQVSHSEKESLAKGVEEACLELHRLMYEWVEEKDPRAIVFTDEASEPGKYVSVVDRYGAPSFGTFVEGNNATDIGVRGVNPAFEGVINPTTVVHADEYAAQDYQERGAPKELVEALDAVRLFNGFIVREVVKPYLTQVAEAFGMNPAEYVQHFFPEGFRANTLTRVIQYHLKSREGMRPVGEVDGVPLLIKQHNDKSSYTIDSVQTSSGLQYYNVKTQEWEAADTKVACFRGSAESFLPERIPPTAHRVVFEEGLEDTAAEYLRNVGIGRLAIPTFVCPTASGDRVAVK